MLQFPAPYFGGKRSIADAIWKRLGTVDRYIEPFCGSASVMLANPSPCKHEILNDMDCYIVNVFRALKADPEEVAYHADYPTSELDLWARGDYLFYKRPDLEGWKQRFIDDPEFYDAQAAGWWLWGASNWIGDAWGASGSGKTKRSIPNVTRSKGINRQLPTLSCGRGVACRVDLNEWFAVLAERLRFVMVTCGDWKRVVTPCVLNLTKDTTAVFLDPPYASTNRAGVYHDNDNYDVANEAAEWALAHGDNKKLRIALCGYRGDYVFPPSWERLEWKAQGGYGNHKRKEKNMNRFNETIYFSPHCLKFEQIPLFD